MIAALYYDIAFDHVRIGEEPSEDGCALGGGVHGVDGTTSHHNWITICMAGVAGQYADREKPLTRLSHADLFCTAIGDYKSARYHIDNLGRGIVATGKMVDSLVDEGVAIAHRLIRLHHYQHAAIAAALLEKGKMAYHDCMRLWAASSHTLQTVHE